MDRIGIFAVGAALVIVSALHIVNAPTWLVAVPAALVVVGAVRLLVVRDAGSASAAHEFVASPTAEF